MLILIWDELVGDVDEIITLPGQVGREGRCQFPVA